MRYFFRPYLASFLLATAPGVFAQHASTCECPGDGMAAAQVPDTIFHVTEGFDVAFCGSIDRSVQPYVYSGALRTCGRVQVPLQIEGTLQEFLVSISNSRFIVQSMCMLPAGPDMKLRRRRCWSRPCHLFVEEDKSAAAIGCPTVELIATMEAPTSEQMARVQARFDAVKPSTLWTDKELLGQVFLCAVSDGVWGRRFRDLRETHLIGGEIAAYYDELLAMYNVASRRVSGRK